MASGATGGRRDRGLGRLKPTKKVTGIWFPVLSLCVVLGGLVVEGLVGTGPGLLVLAVGILLAWFARDAKGRGIATIALVLGISLVLFFVLVVMVGRENIGGRSIYGI